MILFTAVVTGLVAVNVILAGDQTADQDLIDSLSRVQMVAMIGSVAMAASFAVLLSHRLRQLTGKIFVIKLLQPLQPLYQRISDAFGAYRP